MSPVPRVNSDLPSVKADSPVQTDHPAPKRKISSPWDHALLHRREGPQPDTPAVHLPGAGPCLAVATQREGTSLQLVMGVEPLVTGAGDIPPLFLEPRGHPIS